MLLLRGKGEKDREIDEPSPDVYRCLMDGYNGGRIGGVDLKGKAARRVGGWTFGLDRGWRGGTAVVCLFAQLKWERGWMDGGWGYLF